MIQLFKRSSSLLTSHLKISPPLSRPSLSTTETTTSDDKTSQEDQLTETSPKPNLTFAQMFRRSKFVALGDLEGKDLVGRIFDTVGDDLYIDYGGKFNAVCKRPENTEKYFKRNENVVIRLLDFEMATFFLSAAKHLTLLESNAKLIKSYRSSNENKEDERSVQLKNEIEQLNSEPYY